MALVRWSTRAAQELEETCLFLASDSIPAAERFAERVVQGTRRLGAFPRSGWIAPEFGREDIREIIVQGYRIVYRLVEDDVEIATVQHGARPLDLPDVDGVSEP